MKKNKTLVSVVIPVFNGAKFLEETVSSVMKSTYKTFEVLLVDDGSIDKSVQICKKLEKKYSRVKFYSFKSNRGLGRTLNYALQKARGKLICRINQDDIMLPKRLQLQVDFLNSHPEVVALGSNIQYFTDSNETIEFMEKDEDIRKLWHLVSPFADPSVMYRKAIAIKAGGYFQEMWPADDTHLWKRMAQYGKLANLPKVLVKVRWHENMASVKYFRTLAISTYKMHLWIDERVDKASFLIHLFWLGQLVAGLILSPQLNWKIYRIMKRFFKTAQSWRLLLTRILPKTNIDNRVTIQPKKLSFSGA